MARFVIRSLVLLAWIILSPASISAEVLIATAGPFTGRNIFRGEQIQQGAEIAVADINSRGGVLGQRVELLIADDACDPEQAVAVARKLVSDGVIFVAGHVCSHSSIPASKIYGEAGILMISPASTNPLLTDQGLDNVFRVCGRDDQQGIIAGDYLARVWGNKKIAIIHDGSTYGAGLAQETRAQLNKNGVRETLYQAFKPGQRDYSDLVETLQAAAINVAYIGAYSAEIGLIVRQSRDRGYNIQAVAGDAITNEEYWMITGPAGAGTIGTFGPDPRNNPQAATVVQQLRDNGFEPLGYTLHTYAAIQLWALAVEKAGTFELAKVSNELKNGKFQTVLGPVGFDQKGDITAPGFIWYVWKDGEYVPVE